MMDAALTFVAEAAHRHLRADRVLLFGSRARGDHRARSDYDIAVDAPQASDLSWLRFCDDVREHAPTLCSFDLLWLQQTIDDHLREVIEKEGLPIAQHTARPA